MERCAVCGAEEFIPYICRYCGGVHCVYHRLPENHECPNISQARAPKPVAKVERRGASSSLRVLKTPRFSRVSLRELGALTTAWLVLAFCFSVGFLAPTATYAVLFLLTLVIVGTGFLGHELAHKFSAQRYGYWAEFKLWAQGVIMALLFALVAWSAFGGSFVFAAPGAVYIASRSGYFGEGVDRKANGIISAMGPVTNLLASLAFLIATLGMVAVGATPTGLVQWFLVQGVSINLWLGAFNLLPLFILDGQKIYIWDKRIWALLAIPLWVAVFFVPGLLQSWILSLSA